MPKFVKRPVEIEAVQFTGYNWGEMGTFCKSHRDSTSHFDLGTFNPIGTYLYKEDHTEAAAELWVAANNAWLPIDIGEWVIKDELGFYPCKDEIFKKSYSDSADVEYYDEDTMFKVYNVLNRAVIDGVNLPVNFVSRLQNAGILFRERKNNG